MKNKLLIFMLVFILGVTMTSWAYADDLTINTVDISVSIPKSGETAQMEIEGTDSYTGTISWSGKPPQGVFGYGITYDANIILTAINGYKFDAKMTINMAMINSEASTETIIDEVGNKLTIRKRFPATESSKLIKDGIELIINEQPCEGDMVQEPIYAISEKDKNNQNYTVNAYEGGGWKERGSNADSATWLVGEIPKYSIKLSCKPGYVFRSNSSNQLTRAGITLSAGKASVGSLVPSKLQDGAKEVAFTVIYPKIIGKQNQEPLMITNKPKQDKIVYGDEEITLNTMGGSTGIAIIWAAISGEEYATLTKEGVVKSIKSDGTTAAAIVLRASMPGNNEYNVVYSEDYIISIEQRALNIESMTICKAYDKTVDFSVENIKEINFGNTRGGIISIYGTEGGRYNHSDVNEANSIYGITKIILSDNNYILDISELNNKAASIERAKLELEPILTLSKIGKELKALNILDFIKIKGFIEDDNIKDYFNIDIGNIEVEQGGISIVWYKSDKKTLLDNIPSRNGSYIYKISARNENLENYYLEEYAEREGILTVSGIVIINHDDDDDDRINEKMPLEKQHNFIYIWVRDIYNKARNLLINKNLYNESFKGIRLFLFFYPFF